MKRTMILIAAALGALILYVDLSGGRFRDRIERERATVLENRTAVRTPSAALNSVAGLPQPVRKYLRYALEARTESLASARIMQSGMFRLSEKDSWTPIMADQLLTLGKPAFVWHARLQPHPYVWTESRDLLYEGVGRTEHRLYSAFLFPSQRFTGRAADISALVRYLTEAPWLPAALFPSDHLSWKPINSHTAKAILSFNGYQVSADYTFNSTGEIVSVTTENRTLHRSGSAQTLPWTARYHRYERHSGIKVPMEMETEWSINGKSFIYAKLTVDGIVFAGP